MSAVDSRLSHSVNVQTRYVKKETFDLVLWGGPTRPHALGLFLAVPHFPPLRSSPIVSAAVDRNTYLFISRGPRPPHPAPRNPFQRILALHLRRGDYEGHCRGMTYINLVFYSRNLFPHLPDCFVSEPDKAAEAHCNYLTNAARGNEMHGDATLDVMYLLTNEKSSWIDGLKETLGKDGGRSRRPGPGADTEQTNVSMAVDMKIARRAAGFYDSTRQIWDTEMAQQSLGEPLRGHRVWDTETWQSLGEPLRGHRSEVSSVAFSPDGSRIASGFYDGTFQIWNTKTRQLLGEPLRGHRYLESPTLREMLEASQSLSEPLRSHRSKVWSVAFSPDGSRMVSGSGGGILFIWDAKTWQSLRAPLHGHRSEIWSIAFSPVSMALSSVDSGATVMLLLPVLFAFHHVTGLEFKLTAEDDAEAIRPAGILNTGDACIHVPSINFMSESICLVLEEAELLSSQNAVATRRADVGNARVDDRGFCRAADLRQIGEQGGEIITQNCEETSTISDLVPQFVVELAKKSVGVCRLAAKRVSTLKILKQETWFGVNGRK
ncbi:hypothetical protein B0H14DRAFT_3632040 [Mycena olivaceomarginata]|nr:hypothetical protein B0H14DRAFT_3632040 [Mycena olivaceomarginata]